MDIQEKHPVKTNHQEHKQKVKNAQKTLREKQLADGTREVVAGTANRLCNAKTIEEELEERQTVITAQVQTYRSQLKTLLRQFARIPDPRNPNKIKHKLTVILLYGLLSFVYQMTSRRQINKEISRPAFWNALVNLFPELETIPHADTLARLLKNIDPETLENAHVKLLNRFIRNKKFHLYLIDKHYPIAIDGTQKLVRNGDYWEEEWLKRHVGKSDEKNVQRYVYVLEANMVFHNGMTLPVMSEFLFYEANKDKDTQKEKDKQDCELNAFRRLARRLKKHFPCLMILLLLDGLYANGPIMTLCKSYRWQYMIVLKDKSLSTVWDEFNGLKLLENELGNTFPRLWRGRRQVFSWVNNIVYEYKDSGAKEASVHLVVCEEDWEEVDKETGEIITKHSRHAWISSEPITKKNAHERCNLAARQRWGIENSMNTEKKRGYHYEHIFSHNWNAMRCFHALMRIAHMLNELVQRTRKVKKYIDQLGIAGYWELVKSTLKGLWLTNEWMNDLLKAPFQLRLE